jgi:hypothetical protein
MANDDRGPFRSYGRHGADDMRKRYQDRMNNYRSRVHHSMSAAPWVIGRLTEHVADAFLFLTTVSKARDLHEVLTAQSAFVQKKIDMLAGGANVLKVLKDMAAHPGTAHGSASAIQQWRKRVEETARNSPKYAADERVDSVRTWRAEF